MKTLWLVMESLNFIQVNLMKDNYQKVIHMVLESIIIRKEIFMKVNGFMVRKKGMEFYQLMVRFIKENGQTTWKWESANTLLQTATNIVVSLSTSKEMGKEHTYGNKGKYCKVGGDQINLMEKLLLLIKENNTKFFLSMDFLTKHSSNENFKLIFFHI